MSEETQKAELRADDARAQLVTMARTVGVQPKNHTPFTELPWAEVVRCVDEALSKLAQRAAAADEAGRKARQEEAIVLREVGNLHDTIRDLQTRLDLKEAELQDLRANPEMAMWHKRALAAEAALKADYGNSALMHDWIEKMTDYMEDKLATAYELNREYREALRLRWNLEKGPQPGGSNE